MSGSRKPICSAYGCDEPFVVLSGNVTGCPVHGIRLPRSEPAAPSPRASLAEALRARCRDTWHVRHGRQEDCPICRAVAALEAKDAALRQLVSTWDDTSDAELSTNGVWRGSAAIYCKDILTARAALALGQGEKL